MKAKPFFLLLLIVCNSIFTISAQQLYDRVIKVDVQTYNLVKDALLDFQYQLAKGTGKDFIIDDKNPLGESGIQIIKLDVAANPGYDKRLDATNDDAVLIQSDGEHNLKIIAYSRQGLINGIYTYLDTLGFRWYHPGEEWSYAPSLKSIGFRCDKVYKPDFELRTFFGSYGTPRNRPIDPKFEVDQDWRIWSARNRLGGSLTLKGHAWDGIVYGWHDYLISHPDEMALVKGVRVKPDNGNAKFCLSNDDFQKVFIYHFTAQLKKMMKDNPNLARYVVSVEPSDGDGDCECEACKKMGTNSTRVFFMANLVAKEFQKISPNAFVNLYAYNTHAAVPDLDLEPNVIVQVIPYKYQSYASPENMIEWWGKKSNRLFIYDYYGLPLLNVDMPLHNVSAPWRYAERIKFWHKNNIKGIGLESSYSIGATGVGLYLFARLSWDANADEWKILKEYYHRCYGAAYDAVWNAHLKLADDSLERSQTLFKVISQLSKETSGLKLTAFEKAHLTDFKAYTHYLKLLYEMQSKDSKGDTVSVDNLLRYTYSIYFRKEVHPFPINEWPMRFGHTGNFVVKYWSTFNQSAPGMRYAGVVQLTDEEINKLFDDDCRQATMRK